MTPRSTRSIGSIRLLPAVVSEPPYDEHLPEQAVPWGRRAERSEVHSIGQALAHANWTDGSLALAGPPLWRQLPLHLVEPMGSGGAEVYGDGDPSEDPFDDDDAAGLPTPRSELPPPRPAARNYVRALLEVLTGDRALAQLARAATPQVYAQLEATGRLAGPRSWAGTVRSVHVSEPADGVAEVAAVVERQSRCHAVALRLEGRDGRWVMTKIRLGW